MKINDKIKKSIVENVIVILFMSLYIRYGIQYTPILTMLIPLPFIIVGMRNDISNNIISLATTILIVGLVFKATAGSILLMMFAPLTIALNYFIKKRKATRETLLISSAIIFLSILVIVALGEKSTGLGLIEQFEQFFSQIVTMQKDIFKEMGMTNYEILQRIDILEAGYEYMLITLPSIIIVLSFFISYLNYLLTSIILKKMRYEIRELPRFSRIKLPNNFIIGTGLMFLTAIIMGTLKIPYHNALLANISFLVGFAFLVQGLSLIDYFLIKIKMKKIFRTLIIIFSILLVPLGSFLVIIGMVDSIFDFRKIGRRKSL